MCCTRLSASLDIYAWQNFGLGGFLFNHFPLVFVGSKIYSLGLCAIT